MKLKDGGVVNGAWTENMGDLIVSNETHRLMTSSRDVTLFVREEGDRLTNGAIFVFSLPPQGFELQQGNRVAVTYARHGYSVSSGGEEAPLFKFDGHFGWRLRTTKLPRELIPVGLKRNVRYDQQTGDFMVRLPSLGLGEDGAEGWIESALQGRLSVIGLNQRLDGREAFRALNDLCHYYVEENRKRLGQGKRPLELVLHYPLEGLRWVVEPKDMPSLRRRWEEQGKWPYSLVLIGVYDDARPRAKKPEDPWELEPRLQATVSPPSSTPPASTASPRVPPQIHNLEYLIP